MGEVLDFAAEPIRQPREAPLPHPHHQVLALHNRPVAKARSHVQVFLCLLMIPPIPILHFV
jgi:hypothetical protein